MAEENLKQKTKKGLYWQFFNQFANNGLQFCIGIVLARLLTPEDYGITALPAVFLAVAGCLVDCGFGSALVRKPDLSEKDLSTAFYYSISVGVTLYLALFLSSGWIADFYNAPILESVLKVTALGLLFGPVASVQGVQLSRKLDFKTPTKISLTCKITTGILGLAMAFCGYGIWSLVIPGVVGSIINVLMLYYFVRWLPKERWSKESFRYLWGFGSKLLASWLMGTVYENVYPLIIGKFFSPAQLGIWNRAQGYASLPSKQATNVLQSVTFPVLSKMQEDTDKLAMNYRRILRVSAFVVFPIMLIMAAVAHPLVIILVTEKWESCVPFLQIMCFSLFLYPIHAINLNLLQVKGRSDLFLRLEIIKKIVGILIMCITIPIGLMAMAYGMVVSSFISLIINTYYTGVIINVGYWRQVKDLLPIFLMSLASFIAIRAFMMTTNNLYIQLFIGVLIGLVVYLLLTNILHREEMTDVIYMFKRKP